MAKGDLDRARTELLDRVLLSLAYNGGSERLAAKMLRQSKDDPIRITAPQLAAIRNDHPERYQELYDRFRPQIEAEAVRAVTEGAVGAFKAAVMAVDLMRERIENGDVRDPGKAARDLAVTGAVFTDKLLVLTGRPNEIREKRNVDDILKDIVGRLKGDDDTIEAEVIEPPGLPEGGADAEG